MAVGRFQVMATLQAARAYILGKSLNSAKSFGLNRAIFYAAAKKGFKVMKGAKPPSEVYIAKKPISDEKLKKIQETFKIEEMGDELAYAVELDGTMYYTIGNEIQKRILKNKLKKDLKENLIKSGGRPLKLFQTMIKAFSSRKDTFMRLSINLEETNLQLAGAN